MDLYRTQAERQQFRARRDESSYRTWEQAQERPGRAATALPVDLGVAGALSIAAPNVYANLLHPDDRDYLVRSPAAGFANIGRAGERAISLTFEPMAGMLAIAGADSERGYYAPELTDAERSRELSSRTGEATEAGRNLSQEWDEAADRAVRFIEPQRPPTNEVIGVLGAVARMLPPAILGEALGGPIGASTFSAAARAPSAYEELIDSGVSPEDARFGAAIDAFATGAGVMLPAALPFRGARWNPGAFARRAASGAALNVGAGVGMRASVGGYLRAQGYGPEVTSRYDWLDGTAIAADAILGGVFGGVFGHIREAGPAPGEGRASDAASDAPEAPLTGADHLALVPVLDADGNPAMAYAHARMAALKGEQEGLALADQIGRDYGEEVAQDGERLAALMAVREGLVEPGRAEIDAALTVAAERAERMGRPVPLTAEAAHQDARAIRRAGRQADEGEEIDVGSRGDESGFAPSVEDVPAMMANIEYARGVLRERAPQSLTSWVRARGGISDDRGASPLVRANGRPIDELIEAAVADGFFPEHAAGESLPTRVEFLDALAREARGETLSDDPGAAAARQDAKAVLEQYERAGVDTALQGEDLRAALTSISRQRTAEDAVRAALEDEGFAGLLEEMDADRRRLEARGVTLSEDDVYFSRSQAYGAWRAALIYFAENGDLDRAAKELGFANRNRLLGAVRERRAMAKRMHDQGMSAEAIAEAWGVDVEVVDAVLGSDRFRPRRALHDRVFALWGDKDERGQYAHDAEAIAAQVNAEIADGRLALPEGGQRRPALTAEYVRELISDERRAESPHPAVIERRAGRFDEALALMVRLKDAGLENATILRRLQRAGYSMSLSSLKGKLRAYRADVAEGRREPLKADEGFRELASDRDNAVLDLWSETDPAHTANDVADLTGLDPHQVKSIVDAARAFGDPRAAPRYRWRRLSAEEKAQLLADWEQRDAANGWAFSPDQIAQKLQINAATVRNVALSLGGSPRPQESLRGRLINADNALLRERGKALRAEGLAMREVAAQLSQETGQTVTRNRIAALLWRTERAALEDETFAPLSGRRSARNLFGKSDDLDVLESRAPGPPERSESSDILESRAAATVNERGGFASGLDLARAIESEMGLDFAMLRARWGLSVMDNPEQLGAALKTLGADTGARSLARTQAVHVRRAGQTILVASNIAPERLMGVLLHEVGVHHGLREMLGANGIAALDRQIARMFEENHPLVRRAFAKALAETQGRDPRIQAEEVRAYLVEETDALLTLAREGRFGEIDPELRDAALAQLIESSPDLPLVQRLLARLRQWLIKTFGTTFGMRLTVEDIRQLALASLKRVDERGPRAEFAGAAASDMGLASAREQGYEGADTGEAIEWLRAKAKGLDMSAEARMERARAMGFDTETPVYHGTNQTFEAFAAEFRRYPRSEPGFFFTADPKVASAYARGLNPFGAREGANVMPALLRGRFKNVRWRVSYDRDFEEISRIIAKAKRDGFDGVRFDSVVDHGAGFGAPQTIVFDARNIRSIHAAFDPDYSHSANLLGSRNAPAPRFYSAVERTVRGSRTERAPGAQWWATISKAPGVKKEELEWIGLEDFLKSQEGQVSREDVLAFVRANGVSVEETVLGGAEATGRQAEIQRELLPLIEERQRLDDEQASLHDRYGNLSVAERNRYAEIEDRIFEIDEEIDGLETESQLANLTRTSRWSEYALPGGENYRELLLRLPDGGGANENAFRSSHFDQPNILAHVRFNERTDANGKRTLFLEEVQSDWHQAGREQGYREEPRAEDLARIEEAAKASGVADLATGEALLQAYRSGLVSNITDADLRAAMDRVLDSRRGRQVPDAPFKNNAWASLALKRMIRWAAENGFDQIAWTPGQVQLERFSLAREMRRFYFNPNTREFVGLAHGGGAHKERNVTDARLAELLGKEGAQQLLQAPLNKDGEHEMAAGDITIGGEGMRAFYDRILVNIANDIGKKYGARVGDAEINAAAEPQPAHALPITDAMRDAALDEGLPLFSRGGRSGPPVRENRWTPPDGVRLSERERKIAEMAINGAGNQWIAEEMDVSDANVRVTLNRVAVKLGGKIPWERGKITGQPPAVPTERLVALRDRYRRDKRQIEEQNATRDTSELRSQEERQSWVERDVLSESIPGEAGDARQYGFALGTDDGEGVVVSIAPDTTGAATVDWTYLSRLERLAAGENVDLYAPRDPPLSKAATLLLMRKVAAVLEQDVARYGRDAYVWTPEEEGHDKVYTALIRRFLSDASPYDMVQPNGAGAGNDTFLLRRGAAIAANGRILPSPEHAHGPSNARQDLREDDPRAAQTAFYGRLRSHVARTENRPLVRDHERAAGAGGRQGDDGSVGGVGAGGHDRGGTRGVEKGDDGGTLESRRRPRAPVDAALADNPDMTLATEGGEIPARRLIEMSLEAQQLAAQMRHGYEAAVACAIRNGAGAITSRGAAALSDVFAGHGLGALAATPAAIGFGAYKNLSTPEDLRNPRAAALDFVEGRRADDPTLVRTDPAKDDGLWDPTMDALAMARRYPSGEAPPQTASRAVEQPDAPIAFRSLPPPYDAEQNKSVSAQQRAEEERMVALFRQFLESQRERPN